MPIVPQTRASLILRLPSANDADAWHEFVSIYEPFVYRFARRAGLQDADARELVQNVLLAVARAVGRWQPDRERAKFRTWLFRIARNQLIDFLGKRQRQEIAKGGSSIFTALDQQPAGTEALTAEIKLIQRRELFRWAAAQVKNTVKESTWNAFWLTAVDQQPAEDVARSLGMTVGAIYIARSRVLARLRDEIQRWEGNDHEM